jgi:hypothetical protein
MKNLLFTLICFAAFSLKAQTEKKYPSLNKQYELNDTKSILYSVVGNDISDWAYYESESACTSDHCGDDYYAEDWNWMGGDNDEGKPLFCGFDKAEVISVNNTWDTNKYLSYGKRIALRSINNPDFVLFYTHLQYITVSVGDIVTVGEQIGTLGKTGLPENECIAPNWYCAHLHLALYKDLGEPELKRLKEGKNPSTSSLTSGGKSSFAANFEVSAAVPECGDFEPSNSYASAPLITLIGRNIDRLDTIDSCLDINNGDEDWYSIIPVSQGELNVTIDNPGLNIELYYNNDSNLKDTGVENASGNKTISRCFDGISCSKIFIRISAPPNQSVEPNYSLQFNWEYNNGCVASKSNTNFNKKSNSDLTITGDTEICEGESTTLSASGGSGNYKWFVNNNEVGSDSSLTISNLNKGENQIAVIDIDNTCSSGGSTVVTVKEEITANAGNDISIKNGTSTQLQGSGGSIYSWSPSTGLSNTNISNPIASPSETTTYTLTTTKNGCSDTDDVTVTVSQNSNTIDIMIDDIWTVPAYPKEGEEVDLFVRIKNIGTEKVYSINWNYYINTNVVGSDDYYALEANETRTEFLNNYKFTSSGTFDYCVNIETEPNEQNTNNNDYCKQIIIGDFVSEDITVSNVIINSSNIDAGDTFIPSAQLNYSGGRTTNELPDIKLGYYLSKDCNFSNDDVFLDEEVFSIGSDSTSESDSEVVKIPPATEAGNYYILVVGDHTNLINESNETNNTVCKSIVINSSSIPTIEGGIVNPANNLIIHEDNRSAYFQNGDLDDIQIDGWSSTGKIDWIKLYYKSVSRGDSSFRLKEVSNPNNGSWDEKIDITGGEYEVYVTVKCNYGCAQNGAQSEIRQFTYVKPYVPGNFYAYNRSGDVRIDIYPNYNFGNSLNTDFYYRIFRNTSPSTSGGMYLGNWTQEKVVMDTNTNPNQTYYYWVDVAIDSNGNYNSGLVESEYVKVETPTLNTESIELSKFISLNPNPVNDELFLKYENTLTIKAVSIYDLKGRIISKFNKSFNKISTRKLSKGIYIISIKTSKGIISKKIIKE